MFLLKLLHRNPIKIVIRFLPLPLFLWSCNLPAAEAPGTLLWEFEYWPDLGTSPAIGKNQIIIAGELYAIDGSTGEAVWEFGTAVSEIASAAIGTDSTIYSSSIDRSLYALNGLTGAQKWAFQSNGKIDSSPALAPDRTVYFGSDDGKLYALYGSNGTLKWEFETEDDVDSSPSIGSDGTVYFGSDNGKVYALNGSTGALKWEFTTGANVESSPAIGSDGSVYIGSSDGNLYALNGSTGALIWEFGTDDDVDSSPAIGEDGTLYFGSKDNHLYAVDSATGNLKWKFAAGVDVESSPAVASDGTVYVGTDDDKLYAIDGATGDKKWEYTMLQKVDSAPVIGSNGVVYVTSGNSLYALQGTGGPALSSWPMFGQNIRRTRHVSGYTNPNTPVIQSGNSFSFGDDSSELEVGSISATDGDGDHLGYHIVGGNDKDLFTIDPDSGVFSFVNSPDFLVPGDADGDNVYDLVLQAHDGMKASSQSISVNVTLGNPYKSALAFVVGIRVNATIFKNNWYIDPDLGYLHARSDTEWVYQKELGFLFPKPDSNWFFSLGELGWLHIDDNLVEAETLGNSPVMTGYLYSSTKGWIYFSSALEANGSQTALYFDVDQAIWTILGSN